MASKPAVARAVKKWRTGKKSVTVFFDPKTDGDIVEWLECYPLAKSVVIKKALRRYKEDCRK